MQIRDIFDQAVLLEPGESLIVPATSTEELNSMRSSLAQQRRRWREVTNPEGDVLIVSKIKTTTPHLILSKVGPRPPIIKVLADGTKEEL